MRYLTLEEVLQIHERVLVQSTDWLRKSIVERP